MEGDGSGASKMLVGSKHIYIFSLHVFNEAFQLKAYLEDIMRFVYSGSVEIGCRFCLPEERHGAFYSWWRSWYLFKISAEPVKLDFGSHEALVIGYPAHLTKYS